MDQSLDKLLDYFFHLPTLLVLAMICVVLIWAVYDLGVDFGAGFFRLNSNQGHINIYWMNGCCDVDW